MKKGKIYVKKIFVMSAIAFMGIAGMISTGISVLAASTMGSKGAFSFEDGKLSVYNSDLDYLQSEVEALFQELP